MTHAKSSQEHDSDAEFRTLYSPVSAQAPCGENPDDAPDFLMLQACLRPKSDAEYGHYYQTAEPINWSACETLARSLLAKSKDIRLIIILMRCRIKTTGLSALAGGLQTLLELLKRWPDHLHPQLHDEEEFIPQLRANAFAALEDPQGLLADIRQFSLPQKMGGEITVGEFEKAHAPHKESGAISVEMIKGMPGYWQSINCHDVSSLQKAGDYLEQLQLQLQSNLGDLAPGLTGLARLLSLFTSGQSSPSLVTPPTEPLFSPPATEETATLQGEPIISAPQTTICLVIHHRDEALGYLQQLRHWFSEAEPGSPAVQLLAWVEAGIGKSYPELLTMYPPEIISLLKHR